VSVESFTTILFKGQKKAPESRGLNASFTCKLQGSNLI